MTLNLGRVYPLCQCGHTPTGHNNQHGVCERCDSCDRYVAAPDWPILPRPIGTLPALEPVSMVAYTRAYNLLPEIRAIIAARSQACYGSWTNGTPEQIDELARAIVQRYILGES